MEYIRKNSNNDQLVIKSCGKYQLIEKMEENREEKRKRLLGTKVSNEWR